MHAIPVKPVQEIPVQPVQEIPVQPVQGSTRSVHMPRVATSKAIKKKKTLYAIPVLVPGSAAHVPGSATQGSAAHVQGSATQGLAIAHALQASHPEVFKRWIFVSIKSIFWIRAAVAIETDGEYVTMESELLGTEVRALLAGCTV